MSLLDPSPEDFIAALRETRDPNWTDVQHLLQLVWQGEVIARTDEPTVEVEEAKFYHDDWPLGFLLTARNDGLVHDEGEAWRYRYTGKDGAKGKYDLLFRRTSSAPVRIAVPCEVLE